MKKEILKSFHLNEVCRLMDVARIYHQTVNISAWEETGNIVEYNGWYVSSSTWIKGWHRLLNPANGQIRTVPDIYIFKFNGHPVHL